MSDVLFDSKFEKGGHLPASPFSFVSNAGTVTGTVGSNSDRVLIIYVGFSSAATITAVSWNGVSAFGNFIGKVTTSAGAREFSLYGLIAPATGNNSLSCSFTGSPNDIALGAISLYNADQTTGWRNFNSATGTGTAPTVTITTTATSMAAGGFCDNNASSFAITAPATADWDERNFDGNYQQAHSLASGSSVVLAATLGSSVEWAVGGVEVFAVATGPAVNTQQPIASLFIPLMAA